MNTGEDEKIWPDWDLRTDPSKPGVRTMDVLIGLGFRPSGTSHLGLTDVLEYSLDGIALYAGKLFLPIPYLAYACQVFGQIRTKTVLGYVKSNLPLLYDSEDAVIGDLRLLVGKQLNLLPRESLPLWLRDIALEERVARAKAEREAYEQRWKIEIDRRALRDLLTGIRAANKLPYPADSRWAFDGLYLQVQYAGRDRFILASGESAHLIFHLPSETLRCFPSRFTSDILELSIFNNCLHLDGRSIGPVIEIIQ